MAQAQSEIRYLTPPTVDVKKKFMFPQKGDKASLTTRELEMIIEGVNLINKIENGSDSKKTNFY